MPADLCPIARNGSVQRITVIPGESILALRNRQVRRLHAEGGGFIRCGPHQFEVRWDRKPKVSSGTASEPQVQALAALLERRFQALRAECPHWNEHSDPSIQLNCRVPFAGQHDIQIQCIHLALHWIGLFFDTHPYAPDYSNLRSARDVQANVPIEFDHYWYTNAMSLGKIRAVRMEDWGTHFVERFIELERKGQEATALLVQTTNHSMAVGLRVERRTLRSLYHVCFYEPNHTAAHVQAFFDDFTGIAALRARDFTEAALDHWPHAPHLENMDKVDTMLMVEIDAGTLEQLRRCKGAVPKQARTLVGPLPEPSADTMFNLLGYGLDDAIRALVPALRGLPHGELVRRLASHRRRPPFHNVMEYGCPSTVALFGELIEGLPLDQRVKLLRGLDEHGIPALQTAIRKDRTSTFEPFVAMVRRLLPPDLHYSLLNAAGPDGCSALYYAYRHERAGTVIAFDRAIGALPELLRASLLAARSADNETGLEAAVRYQCRNALLTLARPARMLSPAARAYLLRPAWRLARELAPRDAGWADCKGILHAVLLQSCPELLAPSLPSPVSKPELAGTP